LLIYVQGTATDDDVEFFIQHITSKQKKVFLILLTVTDLTGFYALSLTPSRTRATDLFSVTE